MRFTNHIQSNRSRHGPPSMEKKDCSTGPSLNIQGDRSARFDAWACRLTTLIALASNSSSEPSGASALQCLGDVEFGREIHALNY